MKVLIVGGAGYVGSIVRAAVEAEHDCTFLDQRAVPGVRGPSLVGDVNKEADLARAFAGQEAAVWMAMGGSAADNNSHLLVDPAFDVNVKGFYRFLLAADKAGIKRLVYTSSLSVYRRLPTQLGDPVSEARAPDAWDPYGLSKRLGEQLCRMYVQHVPAASVVSLRLMWPRNEAEWPGNEYAPGKNWHPVGPNDLRAVYLAALRFDRPGAYEVQVTGDLGGDVYPNHEATRLLGWQPRGH